MDSAFVDIIRIVGRGRKLQRDLTRNEATHAMLLLLGDSISKAQVGAFLVTMRVKEETVDEIIGFAQGARDQMIHLTPQVEGLVDLALPYDGKAKHFQTGIAVGAILAAAGVHVLLTGADDVPTKAGVGPLNLLRALGLPADQSPVNVTHDLETSRLGVLNLKQVLPQWTGLTPIRHHFGLRTLMNTVEKLLNPADAPIHISGFYHSSYLQRMTDALPGTRRNWIIQGEEGSIDIRPGKKTRVYRAEYGDHASEMIEYMINATDYGFEDVIPLELSPDPQLHADLTHLILAGEPGPAADQVILTAGTLLWMVETVPDIHAGITQARDLLPAAHAILMQRQNESTTPQAVIPLAE